MNPGKILNTRKYKSYSHLWYLHHHESR